MRRISLWVLGTLSALVLIFGYSTSTSGPLATSSGSSVLSSPPVSSSSDTGSSGTGSSGTGSSGTGSSGTAGSSASGTRSVTGSVASTQWGPVQVKLTLASGKITKVTVVQYPSGNPRDAEINDRALPILTQETLDTQNAGIDMVSGATVTSEGYLQSLQSALDQSGL